MLDHVTIVEDAIVEALVAAAGTSWEVFPGDPGEKLVAKGSAWIASAASEFEVVELGGGDGNQDEIVEITVTIRADRSGTPAVFAAREAARAVGEFRAAFCTWVNEHLDLDGEDVVIEATLGEADRERWASGDWWCCEATQKVVARCRTV